MTCEHHFGDAVYCIICGWDPTGATLFKAPSGLMFEMDEPEPGQVLISQWDDSAPVPSDVDGDAIVPVGDLIAFAAWYQKREAARGGR